MAWPVYLYLPNVVGYVRILLNAFAFPLAFTDRNSFVALYLVSFVGDYIDGRFAVWFDQKSTFGAVLDMVTDRMSTACLLMLLSHFYPSWFALFAGLLTLDIFSHWFQMYSSFLQSRQSHKDVAAGDMLLMRLYYGSRPFMAYCCIGAEVLYVALYLVAMEPSAGVKPASHRLVHDFSQLVLQRDAASLQTPLSLVAVLLACAPGWILKQVINVVQLKQASDVCVEHDLKKKRSTTSAATAGKKAA